MLGDGPRALPLAAWRAPGGHTDAEFGRFPWPVGFLEQLGRPIPQVRGTPFPVTLTSSVVLLLMAPWWRPAVSSLSVAVRSSGYRSGWRRWVLDEFHQRINLALESVDASLDVVARDVETGAYIWMKVVRVHGQSNRIEISCLVDGGRSDRLYKAV